MNEKVSFSLVSVRFGSNQYRQPVYNESNSFKELNMRKLILVKLIHLRNLMSKYRAIRSKYKQFKTQTNSNEITNQMIAY